MLRCGGPPRIGMGGVSGYEDVAAGRTWQETFSPALLRERDEMAHGLVRSIGRIDGEDGIGVFPESSAETLAVIRTLCRCWMRSVRGWHTHVRYTCCPRMVTGELASVVIEDSELLVTSVAKLTTSGGYIIVLSRSVAMALAVASSGGGGVRKGKGELLWSKHAVAPGQRVVPYLCR